MQTDKTKPVTSWKCSVCGLQNSESSDKCQACFNTPRSMPSLWVKLAPVPDKFNIKTSAFVRNKTTLVIATEYILQTFDCNMNRWIIENINFSRNCAWGQQYDKETRCIYSYRQEHNYVGIDKFDLNTMLMTKYKFNKEHKFYNAQSIKIDSIHHIFNGIYLSHLIWNEAEPETEPKLLGKLNGENFQDEAFGIAYVKSKQEILIFGGENQIGFRQDTIWRYSIPDNGWELLDIKMPIQNEGFGCVITCDDRYVITFGGFGCDEHGKDWVDRNDIFVFDLFTMKWKKSKLQCPINGFAHAIITPLSGLKKKERIHKLVYAFIRFKCDGVNVDEIPIDVVTRINDMFGQYGYGRVHLFFSDRIEHYSVNVTDILSN